MTLLGKILVLVVFVMTLILGAMVIMLHNMLPRIDTVEKLEQDIKILEAEKSTYSEALIKAKEAATQEEKKLAARIMELDNQIKALGDSIKGRDEQIATLRREHGKSIDNVQYAVISLDKHNQEVKALEQVNQQQRATLEQAIMDKGRLVQEKAHAEVQVRALIVRNNTLEEKLQEVVMAWELDKRGGSGNPVKPLQNVEGLVNATDGDRLVTITIGSDSGLAKGHTLTVFRLDPNWRQSKYVGTLKILEVQNKQAIGELDKKAAGNVKIGDRVGTSVTGS